MLQTVMFPVLAWRQAQVFAKHMAHMRLVVEAAVQCNLRKGLIRALNHGAGRLQPGLHDPGMRSHAREPCELTQKAQGAGAHHGGQIGNAQRPLELGGNAVQHARIAGAGACVGPAGAAILAGHEAQRSLLDGQSVRTGAEQQQAQMLRYLQGSALTVSCDALRWPGCVSLMDRMAQHQIFTASGRLGKYLHARRRIAQGAGPSVEVHASVGGNGVNALLSLQRNAQCMHAHRVAATVGRAA